MDDKNKKIVTILSIFTIIFTLMGGTLAYWTWTSDIRTGVAFTISKDFSCSADGGQDLTATNIQLQPTADCTNPNYALQRTIKVTPEIKRDSLTISLDMWLTVNSLGTGLSNSDNFMYAITTHPNSCTTDVIAKGNFKGLTTNDKVNLLNGKEYTGTNLEADTYYLYIWLDAEETDIATANQSFDLSLGGICTDVPVPEAPVLDKGGMIPVTISEDGVVTTITENDPDWYDYSNKEWANMVLVNENATEDVEGSQPRSYYLSNLGDNIEVNQSDILAYYVWIPRYKYKMPQTKCSDIPENERNIENYPECYAPYTVTDEEKITLIRYMIEMHACNYMHDDTQINNESTRDIELGLSTGRLSDGQTIQSLVEGYEEYLIMLLDIQGDYIFQCIDEEILTTEITLTASEFNGNITFATKEGTIDIAFEGTDEVMKSGNAKTEYRSHPAFWWDDDNDNVVDTGETVPGIWVGKFETTPDKSSTCYTTATEENCNNAIQNPTILPDEKSLINQSISNQFYTSQNFSKEGNIYGLSNTSTNAHMMKNREWGAVAYLSHSEYGINKEVYGNNSYRYYTGRSGGSTSASSETYGTYTWLGQIVDSRTGKIGAYSTDRTLGTNASTTGNVTGVYDMSGGAYEYVMGYYYSVEAYYNCPVEGDCSGFEGLPELKYYDLYSEEKFLGTPMSNIGHCTVETCGGHALYETAGWYNADTSFVALDYPWFMRGGYVYGNNRSLFSFSSLIGGAAADEFSEFSWRSVLVPGFGD